MRKVSGMETKSNRKPLLAFNSPTYLRRMAKELNALPAGFYHGGERWSMASVRSIPGEPGNVTLHISRVTGYTGDDKRTYASTGFSNLENVHFEDHNGREVFASRQPVK